MTKTTATQVLTLFSFSLAMASIPATAQVLLTGPSTLTFSATAGGIAPPAQTVVVSQTGGTAKTFTTSVSTTSFNWLAASVAGGTTPARFQVSVNPAGLPAGTFLGTVTIASPRVANAQISVTLNVAATSQLSAAPSSLLFLRNLAADITSGEQLVFV